jgi:phage terminase large subunit-like protein
VTAWAVSNVVEQVDGKGNIQFTKKKSRGRIDPVKSATIGMSLALRHPQQAQPGVLAEWI